MNRAVYVGGRRVVYIANEGERWPELLRALADDLDEHTGPHGLLAVNCDWTEGGDFPILVAVLDG